MPPPQSEMTTAAADSRRRRLRVLAICCGVLCSLLLAACETLSYYGQAVSGQFRLLTQRQSLSSLLNSPDTSPELRRQLENIEAIRQFAQEELKLPLAAHYSTYVDLQRPYVVWNVFATPEFSLAPLTWCYPVAGCVSYRGYFNEAAARAFAAGLQARGNDVYVGGVAAYSTLGWFSDPVLNTILNRPQHQLAGLLFHELAHQIVYVAGDTEFNESFATAVEQEGLRRWLEHNMSDAEDRAAITGLVKEESNRQQQFVALVQGAAADLRELYSREIPPAEMRLAKQIRLQKLRADHVELKEHWGGYSGYDGWFRQELNNAQLSTVVTYNSLVPAFTVLLDQLDGDLPAFYAEVAALKALPPPVRRARLRALLD